MERHQSSVGSEIYHDMNSLGKAIITGYAITITIVCIILIIMALYSIFNKDIGYVVAQIISAECQQSLFHKSYECKLTVKYSVDGKEYLNVINLDKTSIDYSKEKTIKIEYNKKTKKPIDSYSLAVHKNPAIMIISSIIILILTWNMVWVISKYTILGVIMGIIISISIIKLSIK